ncbi:MAG: hypothetical protein LV479_04680 [Methylacidiphilales bacterium]|nr:hypothetical protein [Candidatus Methylacidiphilales bacterium]
MSDPVPPPFSGPSLPPPPPKGGPVKTRTIVIGCLAAALIFIGLVALILTMMCSSLNNMR